MSEATNAEANEGGKTASFISCPKCGETLILQPDEHPGVALEHDALAYSFTLKDRLDMRINDQVGREYAQEQLHPRTDGYSYVVFSCCNCNHLIGIVPVMRMDRLEDFITGGVLDAIGDIDIDRILFSITNGLLAWQHGEGQDYDEISEQILEKWRARPEDRDAHDSGTAYLVSEICRALGQTLDSAADKHLSQTAERVVAGFHSSLSKVVGEAINRHLEGVEKRIGQMLDERLSKFATGDKPNGEPIPVRIEEVSPNASIQVDSGASNMDVNVTNEPLSVRVVPG